ncbi:MAG: PorP/SprF family type IX secretion system membrane protein [Nitritalea sp.]
MKQHLSVYLLMPLLLLLAFPTAAQQLPQFSQYLFNPIHVNPAYAGYKAEGYAQGTFRDQWSSFPGAPRTLSFSADFSANEGRMGMGLSVFHDEIGPTANSQLTATYAYRIQVGEKQFLSAGLSAGLGSYQLRAAFNAFDPDDPDIPGQDMQAFTPLMHLGIFYHSEYFFGGISAYNLLAQSTLQRQEFQLALADPHFFLLLGGLIPLHPDVQLKPSILIREVQGAPLHFDLNALFLLKSRVWVGGSYRSNVRAGKENLSPTLNRRNAVAAIVEVFISDGLRLGYAYDHNLNALSDLRFNSHEVSLGIYLSPKNIQIRDSRWF